MPPPKLPAMPERRPSAVMVWFGRSIETFSLVTTKPSPAVAISDMRLVQWWVRRRPGVMNTVLALRPRMGLEEAANLPSVQRIGSSSDSRPMGVCATCWARLNMPALTVSTLVEVGRTIESCLSQAV